MREKLGQIIARISAQGGGDSAQRPAGRRGGLRGARRPGRGRRAGRGRCGARRDVHRRPLPHRGLGRHEGDRAGRPRDRGGDHRERRVEHGLLGQRLRRSARRGRRRSPPGGRHRLGARAGEGGRTQARAVGRGRRGRGRFAASGADIGARGRGDRPRVRRLLHGRRDPRPARDPLGGAGTREAGRRRPCHGAASGPARPQPAGLDGQPRGAVPSPAALHPAVQRRGHAADHSRRR